VNHLSSFVDQQALKLQEMGEQVPVSGIPRNLSMTCDRYLANKVVPGTVVCITGIFTSISTQLNVSLLHSLPNTKKLNSGTLRTPYIKVIGMQVDVDRSSRNGNSYTPEEEDEFIRMSRNPKIYEDFCSSIAPSIYGSEDIKKAIACLLFGGSRKVLPDGIRLRGDLNVLLLGDPGIAKSQLLKFVEQVAPIAVYTSGKGSSAAGLTASVIRNPQSVLLSSNI